MRNWRKCLRIQSKSFRWCDIFLRLSSWSIELSISKKKKRVHDKLGEKCTLGPIHSSSVWQNKTLTLIITLTLIHRAIEAHVGPKVHFIPNLYIMFIKKCFPRPKQSKVCHQTVYRVGCNHDWCTVWFGLVLIYFNNNTRDINDDVIIRLPPAVSLLKISER